MVGITLWNFLVFFVNLMYCQIQVKSNRTDEKQTELREMEAKAMEGKIVGGKFGNIKDFPHAVCLNAYCSSNKRSFWVCGSTILNQKLLLTAAHCVDECNNLHKIYAKAGSSNVEQASVTRMVARIKIHNNYDKQSLLNDIALVTLNHAIPLGMTSKRAMIYLNFPRDIRVTVAGWGVTSEQHDPTVRLKYVTQTIWSKANCDKYNVLMPGSFCASSGSKKDYPFAGDSGSGLIDLKGQVVGLVSYRVDEKPNLAFYTNVSYFYNWIKSESKKLYCLG